MICNECDAVLGNTSEVLWHKCDPVVLKVRLDRKSYGRRQYLKGMTTGGATAGAVYAVLAILVSPGSSAWNWLFALGVIAFVVLAVLEWRGIDGRHP